ncbi:kinase-regulated stress-responsive transcription factor skn7 [Phytophthora boehmeriae]|uniref:histidine kinase n=1 Tax=Phytophthora boehmeriae TaxID=109152 RepID=A0A8T1VV35_9STRA|nr:kinase-regulated stress-responsive transcription factor skn7 [Phytophthora boehmeriae]
MDGSIDVDSELGVGSNFFFTVVVRLIDEVDPKLSYYSSEDFLLDPSAGLLSPDGSVRPGEKGENASVRLEVPNQARILVVEDNEFNWEVVKCFLQQDDHLLQWEVNGRDAVKAYTENHEQFDLIFMDCEMPIMDGYTATAKLREFEQEKNLPRIPILGLTAYAMSGDRQKCLNCGMDEFMVKPISKLSLRKAIRQWMRIRYLGQQNAALIEPGKASVAAGAARNNTPTLSGSPAMTAGMVATSGEDASYLPNAPTPMPSFDSDLEDVELMDLGSSSKLAPASRHMQQLDLAQAISNLELDDPMSIGLRSGPAVRTATPTTSIFSLGPSVTNSSSRPTTASSEFPDLLRLSRNTSGSSIAVEKSPSATSATLPYVKGPLSAVASGVRDVQRSPESMNPTVWSHPPFNKKDLPSGRLPSWSGLMPKKKVSFHEDTDFESSHSSRLAHIGDGILPSLLERLESDISVEHEPLVLDQNAKEGASVATHTMDPMSIEIPEGDPVNYSLGVEQCGGQEELFLTLLEKFATTSEEITKRVVDAHQSNDFDTARREAHSLKGSSAYVAALRVSKSAFRVQVAFEHVLLKQSTGEGSEVIAALQVANDCIKVLTKEQRLLRGYLRRNFEFTAKSTNSRSSPMQRPGSPQVGASNQCGVM